MRPVFKIVALLLLALWLPATGHCDLEAAGAEILNVADSHASACGQTCLQDVCHLVEGAAYTKASCPLRMLLAPVAVLDGVLSPWLLPSIEAPESTIFIADDPPAVQVLHRTWSFVRRTAWPARAPNYTA